MLRSSGGERIVGLELEKTEWRGKKKEKKKYSYFKKQLYTVWPLWAWSWREQSGGEKKKGKKEIFLF